MPDVELVLRGRNDSQAAVNQAISGVKQLQEVASQPLTLGVDFNQAQLNAANAQIDKLLKDTLGKPLPVSVDTSNINTQIASVERALAGFKAKAQVGIVSPEDVAQVKRLEAELNNLKGYAKTVGIDLNTTNAKTRLAELQRELTSLQAQAKAGTLTIAGADRIRVVTGEVNSLKSALADVKGEAGQAGLSLKGAFGALSDILGGAGLGSLVSLASGAGIAAAAVAIGKTAIELGNLGAQAITTEKSFDSVVKSIGRTPELLNRLSAAASGTIEQTRLMQLANTALAGASDELGGAFADALPKLIEGARAANQLNPALGNTEFLFNSLVTGIKRGSPMLIDNTGITLKLGEANETYAQSVGKTADQLTEEEKKLALLRATMEGVDRLVVQAGGNLDSLTTSAQTLTTAWQDLRTEIGKELAPGVSATQSGIATFLQSTTASVEVGSSNPETKLRGLREQLKLAQRELGDLATTPIDPLTDEFGVAGIRAGQLRDRIVELEQKIAALTDEITPARDEARQYVTDMDAAAAATTGFAGAAATAKDALTEFLSTAATYNPAMFQYRFGISFDLVGPSPQDIINANTPSEHEGLLETRSRSSWVQEPTPVPGSARDQELKHIKEVETAMTNAGKKSAKEWETAFNKSLDKIKGDLQKGADFSIGLKDMRLGGMNALEPGKNGAFEDIYRLQAWLNDNSWGETAQKLGVTKEQAAKIVSDFQNGIFSPDVIKAIDTDKLANQAQMTDLAEKTQEAFSKAIAKKAGVSTDVTDALLGLKTDTKGNSAIKTSAATAAESMATSLHEKVNDSKLMSKLGEVGGKTWTHIEDGFVEAASQSQALMDAIDAMVAAALGRRGVKSAASATGQY